MADNLRIFGNTYTGVNTIRATDANGNEVVYTAGGGGDSSSPFVLVECSRPSMSDTYTFTGDLESVAAAIENGALPFLVVSVVTGNNNVSQKLPCVPNSLTPYEDYWICSFMSLTGLELNFYTNDGSITQPIIG